MKRLFLQTLILILLLSITGAQNILEAHSDSNKLTKFKNYYNASHLIEVDLNLEKEEQIKQELFQLINIERFAADQVKLKENASLDKSSQKHSDEMAQYKYLDHKNKKGKSSKERIEDTGYKSDFYAENIAYGYESAEKVLEQWMNSEPHKKNILNSKAKALGIGISQTDDGVLYYVLNFGSAN